jgi:hypothetical protein
MELPFAHRPGVRCWKLVVLSVCLCVFLFGLHVKLSQYDPPSPRVQAVSSAKLWVSDHHAEVESMIQLAAIVLLSLLLQFSLLHRSVPAFSPLEPAVLFRRPILLHFRRFFRPPPAL